MTEESIVMERNQGLEQKWKILALNCTL